MDEVKKYGGLTKGEIIFLAVFMVALALLLKSCLFPSSSSVSSGGVVVDSFQSGNYLVIKGRVEHNPNSEKSQLQVWVRDSVGGEKPVDCIYLGPYETGAFKSSIRLDEMSGPGPYEAFVRWR